LATDLILLPPATSGAVFRVRFAHFPRRVAAGEKKNCNQRNLAENGTPPMSWDESVLTKHIRGVVEAKKLSGDFLLPGQMS
jgi:hypothetical protein